MSNHESVDTIRHFTIVTCTRGLRIAENGWETNPLRCRWCFLIAFCLHLVEKKVLVQPYFWLTTKKRACVKGSLISLMIWNLNKCWLGTELGGWHFSMIILFCIIDLNVSCQWLCVVFSSICKCYALEFIRKSEIGNSALWWL
jgi:hypothetical protein